MPKMKTHSGSKKRFRRSGTGKIMRAKAYKSHILTKKSTKRNRGVRQETDLAAPEGRRLYWARMSPSGRHDADRIHSI